MKFKREWAMPNSDTFDIPVISAFVRRYLGEAAVSIDPFARNKRWATHTNDLDPNTKAEHHMDALEFLELLITRGVRADLVIWDPPYSIEQCARSYKNVGRPVTERDTQIFGRWTEHKHAVSRLLEDDGTILSFGWNTQGMGKKHGFELLEVLMVCHGAAHNDTLCIAERRLQLPMQFSATDQEQASVRVEDPEAPFSGDAS